MRKTHKWALTAGILLASLLLRLKKHFPDARFLAVWDGEDAHREGWRPRVDAAYKGNRAHSQADSPERALREQVLSQIPLLKDLFSRLDVPQLEVPGVEADDVLAICALELVKRGIAPVIYSSDKDFCQLLPRGVMLVRDVDKKVRFAPESAESVRGYFNCSLEQVASMRAFLGDPSDGLPSACFNVGPVSAAKYLAAGVDPSWARFELLPLAVQQLAAKLKNGWGRLHCKYRVMQLLETASDPRLTPRQQKALQQNLARCQQALTSRQTLDKSRYQALLKFLAGYQLKEAMRERFILLRLQELEKKIA
jgi:5'-3' exonuclease